MKLVLRHKNSGIVLAGVLVILVSLTLVALTVAQRNTMDEMMAANQRDAVNALTISESGIEAGFALVKNNYVHNQEMKDELLQLPNNILSQDSVSGGNYLVTVIDGVVDDGVVTLNSVGDFNGGVREIEIVLNMLHPGRGGYAILTNDDILSLKGDPEISGPYADIHSNSNVDIFGSPTITGAVTASGDITTQNGTPDVGGGMTSGAATVEIPHVYPGDFREYATIVFTADCMVEAPDGTPIFDATAQRWHGWACKPGSDWTMSSGNPSDGVYDGFYYVHGNVKILDGPAEAWPITVVAEGNIVVGGNPSFRPWGSQLPNDTGDTTANDLLFLAGNDISLSGTTTAIFDGIIAAHMEVEVGGNVTIHGSILAENGLHHMGQEITTGQAEVDIASSNNFDGNMTLVGTGSNLGSIKELALTAWRELVH
jgi:hypothetical protein